MRDFKKDCSLNWYKPGSMEYQENTKIDLQAF